MRPPRSASGQSRSAFKQRSLSTSKRGSWPRCPLLVHVPQAPWRPHFWPVSVEQADAGLTSPRRVTYSPSSRVSPDPKAHCRDTSHVLRTPVVSTCNGAPRDGAKLAPAGNRDGRVVQWMPAASMPLQAEWRAPHRRLRGVCTARDRRPESRSRQPRRTPLARRRVSAALA